MTTVEECHQLEIIDGKTSMAWAGETPWHRLGKKVSNDLTPEQMLEAASLDWTVSKVKAMLPIPIYGPDGKTIKHDIKNSGKSGLIRSRDNAILDIVSDDWEIVQNSEAADFFHEFVMAGDMEMNTAGSLASGQVIWFLAKIKKSFELFGGDIVEGYMLFTSYHKYGFSTDIRLTPVRVVCWNTIQMALNSNVTNKAKFSHRKKFDPSVAKEVVGISTDRLAKYQEMATFLGSRKAKNEDIVSYFKRIFPHQEAKKLNIPSEKTDKLSARAVEALSVLETQPGAKFAEGSWWQPYNTVTYIIDHTFGRTDDSRLYSAWYGPNKDVKSKALNLALEMAKT